MCILEYLPIILTIVLFIIVASDILGALPLLPKASIGKEGRIVIN
jgi:hypothetical protein